MATVLAEWHFPHKPSVRDQGEPRQRKRVLAHSVKCARKVMKDEAMRLRGFRQTRRGQSLQGISTSDRRYAVCVGDLNRV